MYRLKREIIIIWYKTKTEWTKNWMSVRGRQQGQEQWWNHIYWASKTTDDKRVWAGGSEPTQTNQIHTKWRDWI